MRIFFVFLFSFLFSLSLFAQLNFKVGYQYSYSNPTVHNDIIDQLNLNNNSLENYQAMESIKGFHGFQVGARQRFGFVGLNASVNTKFQTKKYEGESPTSSDEFYREHFYAIRSYSLGLEFFIQRISFGGSLDWNKLRVRAETDVRTDRHIIFEDWNMGSTFFVGVNLDGNELLSIAIQPYVQIPLTQFDLTPFNTELNVDANLDDYKEGFMNFGIRIIFQNGHYEN